METPKPGDTRFAEVRASVVPADCWFDPVAELLGEASYNVEAIDCRADEDARTLAERPRSLALCCYSNHRRTREKVLPRPI
jgi:hypothetical protein